MMTTLESPFDSDEETPLLSSLRESPTLSPFPTPTFHSRTSSYIHQIHSPSVITGIVLLVLFILSFGAYLMAVPGIRIYEDIICHHYYDRLEGEGHVGFDGKIDESMCKGEEVQNELSAVVAGLYTLGAIPSLITTIPYGLLADRIGRKPIFILSLVGLVLCASWQMIVMWFWQTLPLRLVWLGQVFILIGGGEAVAAMTFYAIACDITPEANRANIFLLGASSGLVAELFAPTVAAFLMAKSPWIPLPVGTFLLIVGTLLILLIPETLHMRPRSSNPSHLTPSASTLDLNPPKPTSIISTIHHDFTTSLKTLTSSFTKLHSLPIILILLTFIIHPFTRQSVELSLRYISTRFHFPLRLSSLLLSLRALINIILLLILLPLLSHYLTSSTHLSFSSSKKDLHLACASIIILTLGSLLIASSPTLPLTILGLVIFTLGTGFTSLTRSLVTSLVEQHHTGQLYAAIAVVDTVGALIAGPGLAGLYTLGLRLGDPWVGLPFWGTAGVCALSGAGIWGAGWVLSRKTWDGKGNMDVGGEEEGEDAVLVGVEREVVVGRGKRVDNVVNI